MIQNPGIMEATRFLTLSREGRQEPMERHRAWQRERNKDCLLYTSDAADERSSVDLGGRRIIKKKKEYKS